MTDAMYHLVRKQNDVRHSLEDCRARIANAEWRGEITTSLSIKLCDLQREYSKLQREINELAADENAEDM